MTLIDLYKVSADDQRIVLYETYLKIFDDRFDLVPVKFLTREIHSIRCIMGYLEVTINNEE